MSRKRHAETSENLPIEWHIRNDLTQMINAVSTTVYVKEGDIWWEKVGKDARFINSLLACGKFRPATQEEVLDFIYMEKMIDY